jgi:hypothetical protein
VARVQSAALAGAGAISDAKARTAPLLALEARVVSRFQSQRSSSPLDDPKLKGSARATRPALSRRVVPRFELEDSGDDGPMPRRTISRGFGRDANPQPPLVVELDVVRTLWLTSGISTAFPSVAAL